MADPRWHEPRISQIMPTVKCGDCGRDVDMTALGSHRCGNAPPMPALPGRAPAAPITSPNGDYLSNRIDKRGSVDSLMSLGPEGTSFDTSGNTSYLPAVNGKSAKQSDYNDRETKDLAALKPSLNFLEKYNQMLGGADSATPVPSLPPTVKTSSPSSTSKSPPAFTNVSSMYPRSPEPPSNRDVSKSPRHANGDDQYDRPSPRPPPSSDRAPHRREPSASFKISPPDSGIRRAVTPNPYSGTDRSFTDPRDYSSSAAKASAARTPYSPQPPISRSLTPTAQDMQRGRLGDGPRPAPPVPPSSKGFGSPRAAPRPPPPAEPDRSRSPAPPANNNGASRSRSRNRDRSDSPSRDPRSSEYQLIKQQPAWITQARPSLIPARKEPPGWMEPSRSAPRPPPMPPNAATRAKELATAQPFAPPAVPTRNYTPPSQPARNYAPQTHAKSSSTTKKQDIDALLSDLKLELTAVETRNTPVSPNGPKMRKCAACNVKIVATDVAIDAMGKSYHRACFRCRECRRNLDQTTGYHQEAETNVLLCDRDHQARTMVSSASNVSTASSSSITKICQGCSNVIVGRAVKALNAYWHDAHLLCAHCKKPLFRGHVEHRNRAYCQEDFAQLFLPKCKGCRQPVEREALAALDGKWHPHCFVCQICSEPFPDRSFYVYEGKPYCRLHYHKLNNSLCRGCNQPIEGPCAQVIEGRFHPRCFVCETCQTALTDVYYNVQGSFFCEYDVQEVQRRTNKRAEKRQTYFRNI